MFTRGMFPTHCLSLHSVQIEFQLRIASQQCEIGQKWFGSHGNTWEYTWLVLHPLLACSVDTEIYRVCMFDASMAYIYHRASP